MAMANEFDYVQTLRQGRGGFNFDNYERNIFIESKGITFPPARKTGTTICGVVCAEGIVLGADTRATEGEIVADKNCEKLHHIADNIYCAGAGTSADLEHTTDMIASNVELHRLTTNRQPRVATVVSSLSHLLFKYQGHIGCALVLGGVDVKGPQLYMIHPHGSTDRLPFAAMGSGSLNAMAILEGGYKDGMTLEEGKALVADAIRAGIFNDLGSGGNVDLIVLEKDNKTYHRGYDTPNDGRFRMPESVKFQKGTTPFLREKVEEIKKLIVVEEVTMSDD